jgi:inner membrane protein
MSETMADPKISNMPPPLSWAPLRTPAAKIGMILALILLMQIPHFMVAGLIQERQQRQAEVLAEFRHGWGPEQSIAGPMLIVPWHGPGSGATLGWARVAASKLDAAVNLMPEERRRGLFHATIYRAAVELKGTITVPDQPIKDQPGAILDWSAARVLMGATDLRGTGAAPVIMLNGIPVPMRAGDACQLSFLEAALRLDAPPAPGSAMPFDTSLTLRGTQAFRIIPFAQQLTMSVSSSWRDPSFVGATLPLDDQVTRSGFTAAWQVTGSPADFGWQLGSECSAAATQVWSNNDGQIGVALQEAVPTYAMIDRAAKYGVLFLILAYLTLFLFEMLSRVRIHLVQYGMVGLSISLFALLLISIAEPLGFTVSYAISAFAVVAQASLYTLSVVGQRRLAGVFAAVLAALFAFLYVVLSLDAYALLAGTVALFVILSVVMRVTRRVNWAASPAAS